MGARGGGGGAAAAAATAAAAAGGWAERLQLWGLHTGSVFNGWREGRLHNRLPLARAAPLPHSCAHRLNTPRPAASVRLVTVVWHARLAERSALKAVRGHRAGVGGAVGGAPACWGRRRRRGRPRLWAGRLGLRPAGRRCQQQGSQQAGPHGGSKTRQSGGVGGKLEMGGRWSAARAMLTHSRPSVPPSLAPQEIPFPPLLLRTSQRARCILTFFRPCPASVQGQHASLVLCSVQHQLTPASLLRFDFTVCRASTRPSCASTTILWSHRQMGSWA